ncbi:Histone-fold protein [Raphanus sativus]|nr:Histone-fold protein [Raphanus sativus]
MRTKRHDQRWKRRKGKGHKSAVSRSVKRRSSVPRGKIRQVPQDEKRRTKRHVDQRWKRRKGKGHQVSRLTFVKGQSFSSPWEESPGTSRQVDTRSVSAGAPVYLAAVLEYLAAEMNQKVRCHP